MDYSADLSVPYSEIMPIRIRFYNYNTCFKHWHPETELFFVLSGSAEVLVEDISFHVSSEDVFLVNANDLHQITGKNCEMLSLQFQADRLPYLNQEHLPRFQLNSSGNTHASKFDYVRCLIAQFVKLNASGEHIYKTLSMTYALYSHLTENFQTAPLASITSSRKNRERVLSIISYIEDHYRECLTLAVVAENQGLSVPYLASFFEKNTGKTFLTFYNEIRLTHATHDLLYTDESIENISLSNGFSDSRSFVSIFRKKYHMLPSAYRKQNATSNTVESPAGLNQLSSEIADSSRESILKASGFKNLVKYQTIFQKESSLPSLVNDSSRIIDGGTISMDSSTVTLSHNFHRLICVGSAKQFLYQEVQDMIRITQQEIHYDYVKFHGLLSDDMMVYMEKPDGTPVYSFTLIDKMMDFLLSVDLRPLCQLSFMPIALASDPNRMVDSYHFNTSPPKDLKKWTDLIDALIRHFISRYGRSEVRRWLFCVWNEPDETVNEFSWQNREQFFQFFCTTYHTVKAIDSQLKFGSPSLLLSILEEDGWAAAFFRYVTAHDCTLDFLNIHYYDNTIFESDSRDRQRTTGFSAENMAHSFPLSVDPYAFMKFINNLKLLLKKHQMRSIPVYLTEWNLTISHRDLINDTCFKSCYLVKNLLENYDRLESFGYWCLTDFIEELQIPNDLFHGGLGMFTYNGIPKAHYNAFRFLSRLGNELLGKGDGYFITKKEDRLALLLYNYEHYSKLFASGARTGVFTDSRYTPFEEMNTAQFMVQFSDVPQKKCLVKERFINQYNGSSYDAWVQMGAQPLTGKEDLDLLQQLSQPGMYLHQEQIENGLLTLHVQLAPLEVRLIEIEFQ